MDARPIGVFDSGLGGLTTVKKLTSYLPEEDIIYLGDTGRVPYGSRSRETIIKYACQDAAFLAGFDIKAMVIACNTVSSTAYEILDKAYDIPVFEVISAPVRAAVSQTVSGRIGVIGTAATIRSGAYSKAIRDIAPEVTTISVECPLFVPLAENGRVLENDIAALTIAGDYLLQFGMSGGIDTLIMGCTHYPLLQGVIAKTLGQDVRLVDSGAETAKVVAEVIRTRELESESGRSGAVSYYVTDGIDGFTELASRLINFDVRGRIEQITLE